VVLCIAVKQRKVLHNGWDIFDITITLVSVLPSASMLSALRVLRVIRMLRLISFVPHRPRDRRCTAQRAAQHDRRLRDPGRRLLQFRRDRHESVPRYRPFHYGSLGRSATHLYSIMVSLGSNLESKTVFSTLPWAYLIFGIFIIIASFGLLNMFIAVIVAALKEQLDRENVREERAHFARREEKVDALSAALEALRKLEQNEERRLVSPE
jgi:voltage-gated sodium channel